MARTIDAEATVGLVGLGALGLALGRHVAAVLGQPIVGVDVDARRRAAFETPGRGEALASVDELGAVDRVIVTVPSEDAVLEVTRQLARRADPPQVFVLSTLGPDVAARFDDPASGLGERCWPVPVTGGEIGALRGQLLAIVPDRMPAAAERFLLATVAAQVVRVPDSRRAALLKLLGNALIAYEFSAVASLMKQGVSEGLDAEALLAVLCRGSSGSPALTAVHDYPAAGLAKDLQLLGMALPPIEAGEGADALGRIREHFHGAPQRQEW